MLTASQVVTLVLCISTSDRSRAKTLRACTGTADAEPRRWWFDSFANLGMQSVVSFPASASWWMGQHIRSIPFKTASRVVSFQWLWATSLWLRDSAAAISTSAADTACFEVRKCSCEFLAASPLSARSSAFCRFHCLRRGLFARLT
jgi:hypothetical protein